MMIFNPLRPDDRVFIAGHNGMLGKALCRKLSERQYNNIIKVERKDCDLTDSNRVDQFIGDTKPTAIMVAAARVGGILANNSERASFIFDNIRISTNLIQIANKHNVHKLIYFSSSCVYPRECPQPISEDDLLSGELEPTNRPYALAKIAGMEMVNAVNAQYGRGYYSVLPCNLYGPWDNFHPKDSHVIPGLIRRLFTAKRSQDASLEIWGSGQAKRELMHVDDCADGVLFLAENLSKPVMQALADSGRGFFHFNLGSGEEISILALAEKLKELVGFEGQLTFNKTLPDGTQRKLLDSARLRQLGWKPTVGLDTGLLEVVDWVKNQYTEWAS